jgi:hypothetical protein
MGRVSYIFHNHNRRFIFIPYIHTLKMLDDSSGSGGEGECILHVNEMSASCLESV